MNFGALFDRLAGDLAGAGVVERGSGGVRTLQLDGTPFARLTGEHMAFLLPSGSPARGDALALHTSSAAGPSWVEVSADDVSEWPRLAEQALTGLRRDDQG